MVPLTLLLMTKKTLFMKRVRFEWVSMKGTFNRENETFLKWIESIIKKALLYPSLVSMLNGSVAASSMSARFPRSSSNSISQAAKTATKKI